MGQVKVSKHLNYMKERGLLEATRCENRTFYSIAKGASPELENNMKCLQDCSKEYPVFLEDLNCLKSIYQEVGKVKAKCKMKI